MKVYKNYKTAKRDMSMKEQIWLNSLCPWNTTRLCGNWCALCKIDLGDAMRSAHVVLGCKSDIKIYIDEIVEK